MADVDRQSSRAQHGLHQHMRAIKSRSNDQDMGDSFVDPGHDVDWFICIGDGLDLEEASGNPSILIRGTILSQNAVGRQKGAISVLGTNTSAPLKVGRTMRTGGSLLDHGYGMDRLIGIGDDQDLST